MFQHRQRKTPDTKGSSRQRSQSASHPSVSNLRDGFPSPYRPHISPADTSLRFYKILVAMVIFEYESTNNNSAFPRVSLLVYGDDHNRLVNSSVPHLIKATGTHSGLRKTRFIKKKQPTCFFLFFLQKTFCLFFLKRNNVLFFF